MGATSNAAATFAGPVSIDRIVFMGTPELARVVLAALLDAGENVVGVVTQPDRVRGRSKRPLPPPVKELALARGIDVYQPRKVRTGEAQAWLEARNADIAVVAAYGKILPLGVLDAPRLGSVNVHASLLPKYRGAAPIQLCIVDGATETGVTIMAMDEGMDTGDALYQRSLALHPQETSETLHERLANLGGGALVEALARLRRGEITPTPQLESEATYASMLKKDDARIDWTLPAHRIHAKVRGHYPWPGSQTDLRGDTLKVLPFRRHEAEPVDATPGQVVAVNDGTVMVACGKGAVWLEELQLPGKRRLPVRELLRGYSIGPGDRFEAASTGSSD